MNSGAVTCHKDLVMAMATVRGEVYVYVIDAFGAQPQLIFTDSIYLMLTTLTIILLLR